MANEQNHRRAATSIVSYRPPTCTTRSRLIQVSLIEPPSVGEKFRLCVKVVSAIDLPRWPAKIHPRTYVQIACGGVKAVSYTHLTLPTIA